MEEKIRKNQRLELIVVLPTLEYALLKTPIIGELYKHILESKYKKIFPEYEKLIFK